MTDVLVVGAAIIHRGRVLAARRTRPDELAGRWELPGGKVEPGEDPDLAVVREVREELGCDIVVTGRLDGEQPVGAGHVLRVVTARLVTGEPVPHEHDAVRWLAPGQLREVHWLDPDVPFLVDLEGRLHADSGGERAAPVVRAVFYDEDDAHAAADRLTTSGFRARVLRERFAGEDHDEDHPWAVVTDAPEVLLDVLVEELDGWLEPEESEPVDVPPPPELPQAPKRRKNRDPKS